MRGEDGAPGFPGINGQRGTNGLPGINGNKVGNRKNNLNNPLPRFTVNYILIMFLMEGRNIYVF